MMFKSKEIKQEKGRWRFRATFCCLCAFCLCAWGFTWRELSVVFSKCSCKFGLLRTNNKIRLLCVLNVGTALKICHSVTSSPHQSHNHRTRDRPKLTDFERVTPKLLVLDKRVARNSGRLIIANKYRMHLSFYTNAHGN